jgi:hypothetical protein
MNFCDSSLQQCSVQCAVILTMSVHVQLCLVVAYSRTAATDSSALLPLLL